MNAKKQVIYYIAKDALLSFFLIQSDDLMRLNKKHCTKISL